jgi:CRP/FNR family transcriptional regulator, cyclic AMP receptor protein
MNQILVIEDNRELRENTAELLEIAGYSVITAKNGKEGMYQAMRYLPDLIICDVQMPLADGEVLARTVKAEKATKHIPLIFFTAGSGSITQVIEKSAADFILKPFTYEMLLKAVRKFLTPNQQQKIS